MSDPSDRFLPEFGIMMENLERMYLNRTQVQDLTAAIQKAHDRYLKDIKPRDDDREQLTLQEYWDKWCDISP